MVTQIMARMRLSIEFSRSSTVNASTIAMRGHFFLAPDAGTPDRT